MEGEGTRMKKFRFSIWGLEWGADHDVEIVQVNTNPEAVKQALEQKTLKVRHSILTGGKVGTVKKYSGLRIVENTHE
jgi:hypothetical protein